MVKLIKEANDLLVLWRDYGPGTKAIDLKLMFEQLVLPKANGDKCIIVEADFDSFEGLMILDESSNEWRIGVSTQIDYLPRRNFTLAHEIGHFIGHRHLRKRFECSREDINDFQNDRFEVEANEFAAHLLMPPDVIRDYDRRLTFNHENVEAVATSLNVSKLALAHRWVKLTDRPIGFGVSRDGLFTSGRASDALYKKGTFFRFGDEVPKGAKAHQLNEPGANLSGLVASGIWNKHEGCMESSFATTKNGYVYTYLEIAA